MTDVLVYETSDPAFANRAIEALEHSNIPSFQTGRSFKELRPGVLQDLGGGICIYIRRQDDYAEANRILVSLGAYVQKPLRLNIPKGVLFLLGVLLVVVLFIALRGNNS